MQYRYGGPFNPDHHVYPLADAGILLEEARINQVLAAGVGNAVIDDRDFPVISDVDALEQHADGIDMQGFGNVDTGSTHFFTGVSLQEFLASKRVKQDA